MVKDKKNTQRNLTFPIFVQKSFTVIYKYIFNLSAQSFSNDIVVCHLFTQGVPNN